MDTLGNVVDKLFTVNMKKYYRISGGSKDYKVLKNLSSQSDRLSNEIDQLTEEIVKGNMDEEDITRPQHKTY